MVDARDFVTEASRGGPYRYSINIVGLLMSIVSGVVLAIQTGIVASIGAVGDTITALYAGATSFIVDLIDAAFGAEVAARIATNAAIRMVQDSGILAFGLAAVSIALLLYFMSRVIQL